MQLPSSYGLQHLWSSWTTALISSGLGVLLIYYVFKFLLTARSSKQIDFLVELTAEVCGITSSAANPTSTPASESQNSDPEGDDFEFEDDDNWETEGVERHTTNGRGRRGESYSGLHLNKKTSLVRITSSDPSSTLSTSPIQLDLDNGNTHRRNGSGLTGGVKANHAGVRRVNGNSSSNSSSPHRKRKESGLSSSSPSPGSSPNLGASSSTNSSDDGFSSNPADLTSSKSSTTSTSTSTSKLTSSEENSSIPQRDSLHGITGLNKSPLLPPSILKTKPEKYCGASLYRQDDQNFNTSLYPDSRGRFGANALGLAPPSRRSMAGGGYSSASAYLLPSASVNGDRSQYQVDDSSLNSPSTNSSISSSPADSPPSENVPMGLGFGNQTNGMSWPNRRMKMIKLMEPDWSPYVQSHERARERLETAAHVAIIQSRGGSFSLPSSPISSPNTKRMGRVGIEDFRNSTIENLEEFPLLLRDSSRLHDLPSFLNNDSEAGDEDFWFERHVQSTAASGRDWDWRKRRARIAKAQNLELARTNSLNQDPSNQNVSNNSHASNGINGVAKNDLQKNDVQLQPQQRTSSRIPPTRTRSLPSSPLISFTPQELANQASNLPKYPRMDSSPTSNSVASSNSNPLSIDTSAKSLKARGDGSSSPAFANLQTEGASGINGRSQSSRVDKEKYGLPQLTTSDHFRLYSPSDETSRWNNSISGGSVSSSSSSNGKQQKAQTSSSLRKKLMGSKNKASASSELLFSPNSLDLSTRSIDESSPSSFAPLGRSFSNSSLGSFRGTKDGSVSTRPGIPSFGKLDQSTSASSQITVPTYPTQSRSRRSSDPEAPSVEVSETIPIPTSKDSSREINKIKPQRPRVRTMSLESTVRKKEEIDMLLREAEEYRSEEDGEGAFETEESPVLNVKPIRPPKASKKGILAGMSVAASNISSPPKPKRNASYRDSALGIHPVPNGGSSPVSGWSSADAYGPTSSNFKTSSINGSSISPSTTRPQIKSIDTNSSTSSYGSNKVGSIHSSDSGSQSEKRWKPDTSKGSGLPITLNYAELPASASDQTSSPIGNAKIDDKFNRLLAPNRRASTTGSSNGSTSSSSLRRRNSNVKTSTGLLGGSEVNKTTSSNGSISSSTGTGDPPVMRYPRHSAKSSKRSTILNSADGASQILISQGNRGKGSLRQLRSSSLAPEPALQPEPAPLGMIKRARSASINSSRNNSNPPSPRSQAFEKLTQVDSSKSNINGLQNRRSLPNDPSTISESTLASALKAEHRLSSPPATPPPADPLPPLPKS